MARAILYTFDGFRIRRIALVYDIASRSTWNRRVNSKPRNVQLFVLFERRKDFATYSTILFYETREKGRYAREKEKNTNIIKISLFQCGLSEK